MRIHATAVSVDAVLAVAERLTSLVAEVGALVGARRTGSANTGIHHLPELIRSGRMGVGAAVDTRLQAAPRAAIRRIGAAIGRGLAVPGRPTRPRPSADAAHAAGRSAVRAGVAARQETCDRVFLGDAQAVLRAARTGGTILLGDAAAGSARVRFPALQIIERRNRATRDEQPENECDCAPHFRESITAVARPERA